MSGDISYQGLVRRQANNACPVFLELRQKSRGRGCLSVYLSDLMF